MLDAVAVHQRKAVDIGFLGDRPGFLGGNAWNRSGLSGRGLGRGFHGLSDQAAGGQYGCAGQQVAPRHECIFERTSQRTLWPGLRYGGLVGEGNFVAGFHRHGRLPAMSRTRVPKPKCTTGPAALESGPLDVWFLCRRRASEIDVRATCGAWQHIAWETRTGASAKTALAPSRRPRRAARSWRDNETCLAYRLKCLTCRLCRQFSRRKISQNRSDLVATKNRHG